MRNITDTLTLLRLLMTALSVFAVLTLFPSNTQAGENERDIFVVMNRGVKVSSLSMAELKAIFLRERKYLEGNKKVIAINAKEGSDLRQEFRRKVLKMDANEERGFWEKKKIHSMISPPPEFKKLLKATYMIKGAISYIYRKDYHKGVVNVLMVLPAK